MTTRCLNRLSRLQHINKEVLNFYRPQDEVAKVMFSQACVCPRGGGAWSWGVPGPRGVPTPGGVWSRGGAWSWGEGGETATAADGTHPTGMHSCGKCEHHNLTN